MNIPETLYWRNDNNMRTVNTRKWRRWRRHPTVDSRCAYRSILI